MDELAPGFWTWTAPHPDWTPDDAGPAGWERDVRSAALAGAEAASYYDQQVVLWLPEPRAVFAGDAFAAPPPRFQRDWLPPGTTVEEALPRLRPLLDLPVEIVVVGHGEPVRERAHEALARALEA